MRFKSEKELMERVVAETEEALQKEKSANALTRQEVHIAGPFCGASAHSILLFNFPISGKLFLLKTMC